MSTMKAWFAKQFVMEDLDEPNYVLSIQIIHDKKNKSVTLSQTSHIDKILSRCNMQDVEK